MVGLAQITMFIVCALVIELYGRYRHARSQDLWFGDFVSNPAACESWQGAFCGALHTETNNFRRVAGASWDDAHPHALMRLDMIRLLLILMLACVVVACAPLPPKASSTTVSPPMVPPVGLRPPATPAEQLQAQRIAMRVAELLEAGSEEEARKEIDHALSIDPANKLALSFQRQLSVDPITVLGTESFSYTLKQGETLSKVAGRMMGDIYSFYLLARYNDIKAPKLVSAGQIIKVPGKAPPPEPREPKPQAKKEKPSESLPEKDEPPVSVATPAASPSPPPAPPVETVSPAEKAYREGLVAQKAGDREQALRLYRHATQLDSNHADARAKAEQMRKELVLQYERGARIAFARQDLNGAIRSWTRVLELDSDNETAKLERQKAVSLKQKVESLGK